MKWRSDAGILIFILLAHLGILWRYGTAIPAPMPPEEYSFTDLSRNIISGRGIVTRVPSELFPFPGVPQPFYVPVVTYAAALGLWGAFRGFDLPTLRELSRWLSALDLLLLYRLALSWGIPRPLSWIAVAWTALDVVYQLTGNIIRSDRFCLTWVLLGVLAFTEGWERRRSPIWWVVSGVCMALSLFAHAWLAAFLTAWLTFLLLLRYPRVLPYFLSPIGLAVSLWGFYALRDTEQSFLISRLVIQDKTALSPSAFLILGLGVSTLGQVLGAYPSNSPIWLAPLIALTWAWGRGHLRWPGWRIGLIWMAYLTGYLNRHPWYAGWFTPFGYLAVAGLLAALWPSGSAKGDRFVRGALLLLSGAWMAYQGLAVWRNFEAAPRIQAAHQAFFEELARDLPPNASVWLFSVPDPSFYLTRVRPDLTIYVGTGYFAFPYAWFWDRIDVMVFTASWVLPKGVLPPYRTEREWQMPAVLIEYSMMATRPIR
jgi:hypothetical protein